MRGLPPRGPTYEGVFESHVTVEVRDADALACTRELIRRGFPVGPSSGLNYRAAVEVLRQLGDPTAQVVTVFPDRMERYFTTELFTPYTG